MAKRHPDDQVHTERQVSLREALELICATADGGHANGHWHGVAVKIARAALLGYPLELWSKDWDTLRRNAPPNVSAAIIPSHPIEEVKETRNERRFEAKGC